MGKKSKDKRRKLKYTKTEFKEIVCSKCALCRFVVEPEFCYGEVYSLDPKKFIRSILKNLLEVKTWVFNKTGIINPVFLSDDDIEYIFKMAFCSSNCCDQKAINENGACNYLSGCLGVFRRQLKDQSNDDNVLIISNRRKMTKSERKRERKAKYVHSSKNTNTRYVPHPYPTFFCNEGMKGEVRRIVDGNCSEQQDTGKESS